MESHESLLEKMKEKTRIEMKDYLLDSVPEGSEIALLERCQTKLNDSRRRLLELRAERGKIMREVSIRQRKMTDWKGKIPRRNEPTPEDVARELDRVGHMPAIEVARFEGRETLRFEKYLASGLTDLDGFEKMWIIMIVPEGLTLPRGKCQNGVYLYLVDVIGVDKKQGLVSISGLELGGDLSLLEEVRVLDVKPYLAYCEAL